MEAKGVDCLFENSDSLSECFEKATDGIDFEDVELSYAECQSIVDIKNCTITAMDGCAKPKASEQIEEFFKSLYAISPCASKEKPETTTINSKEDVVTAEKEIVVSEITNNEV